MGVVVIADLHQCKWNPTRQRICASTHEIKCPGPLRDQSRESFTVHEHYRINPVTVKRTLSQFAFIKVWTRWIKKMFIRILPYRSCPLIRNKNETRAGFKKHQCIISHSKASRLSWRGRRRRGILSVTICRWRSHRSGLGFWFWAARIVSADGSSWNVRSCPGWGGMSRAAHSASCTGPPSCRTPWRRSCESRSPWLWFHCLPPRCGSPRLSAECSPGSRPGHNRQEQV